MASSVSGKSNRFDVPPVPKGELSPYAADPYGQVPTQFALNGSKKRGVQDAIVRPNDELLISKGGLQALNIYRRLLTDSTVQAGFSKVCQEVTSRELIVDPVSDLPGDLAVKDFVEYCLKRLPMDQIFRGLLEAYILGYSVAEVVWAKTPRGVVPADVRIRDARRFLFQESEDAKGGFTMRMITKEDQTMGVELPARKFIVFRYWATHDGDPYGSGLGRILYPLVKFKRRAIESEVLFSDRFATPTAIATAPLSATVDEINTLYGHISNLSQETALILPEGFQLDFANPQGSPEVFTGLRDALVNDITTLIAGEAETGNKDAGSRASSEVANDVRVVRAKELSEALCQELSNTLVRWIVDLNYSTTVQAPTIYRQFQTESDSQLTVQDVALLVEKLGLRPTKDWVINHFKVELEDEEEKSPEEIEEGKTPVEKQQEIEMKKAETDLKQAEAEAEGGEDGGEDDEATDETVADGEEEGEGEGEEETTDEEINALLAEILGGEDGEEAEEEE
jgi:phage gp29-like protein